MNRLLEERIIEEMACGSNFAYILQDNSYFVTTDYKVLQSQQNGGFVNCMKMTYNGKTELFYLIDSYRSFLSVVGSISADTFLTIVKNIFTEIIEARNNGFLSCQNIDISWDKIFVDTNTLKVRLVYIPSSRRIFEEYISFENELRTGLIKLIHGVPQIVNASVVIQFVDDLADGTLTLEDLCNKLKGKPATDKMFGFEGKNENMGSSTMVKMIGMNTPERFEAVINKDEMVLGKKEDSVDIVITFNRAISRIHCKIIRKQGGYYISDLGSANGTYVNKKKLMPNECKEIRRGDFIRLANSDFQII